MLQDKWIHAAFTRSNLEVALPLVPKHVQVSIRSNPNSLPDSPVFWPHFCRQRHLKPPVLWTMRSTRTSRTWQEPQHKLHAACYSFQFRHSGVPTSGRSVGRTSWHWPLWHRKWVETWHSREDNLWGRAMTKRSTERDLAPAFARLTIGPIKRTG